MIIINVMIKIINESMIDESEKQTILIHDSVYQYAGFFRKNRVIFCKQ